MEPPFRTGDRTTLQRRRFEHGALTWQVLEGGTGPALVFLHGTGGSVHSMEPVMGELADTFRVVALDLPGHGGTDYPGFRSMTLVSMASLVADVIRALTGTPHAVVGHSAGAAIALQMHLLGLLPRSTAIIAINAALRPHVLSSLGPFSSLIGAITSTPLAVHAARTLGGIKSLIEGLLGSTGSRLSSSQVAAYVQLFTTRTHAEAAYAMSANWDLGPLWEQLGAIHAPVFLVAGEADAWVPWRDAERAAARIPGARVTRWPRLGHLAHEEDPGLAARTIRALLASPLPA